MAGFEIARRSAADDAELNRVYREVFGEAQAKASQRRWRWQYLENPHGSEPVIWVARQGERPVGQMATMPAQLKWGESEVEASWGMDYFVRPDLEGRGLGPALARAWFGHVDVALAVGLTPAAHAVYRRLGYSDLGRLPFLQRVLDPGAVARRRLGRLLGTLAGPLLRLGLWLWLRPGRGAPTAVEVRQSRGFGPEHDALWEQAKGSYAMCVRRDARYLHWKYAAREAKGYRVHEAWTQDRLTGFAVSRHEDYQGLRLGWLIDVFAEASDRDTKRALIQAALAELRAAGVARVQAFCLNRELAEDLRGAGFFSAEARSLFCVKAPAGSEAVVADPGRWHVVFGDGDMDR